MRSVHVKVFTDGYTKILRIDDKPSEESKTEIVDPIQLTTFKVGISMINVSVVGTGKELFTLYLEDINAQIEKRPKDLKIQFSLASM